MLSKQKPGVQTGRGPTHYVSTTLAREKISQIVLLAQDPRAAVVLTRHGQPVAAVVSMAELKRIEGQQDVEDISLHGVRQHKHWFGPSSLGARTPEEAAEKIQAIQLDRLMEREVLERAGLPVVKGGELEAVAEVKVPAQGWRRWWPFRRR